MISSTNSTAQQTLPLLGGTMFSEPPKQAPVKRREVLKHLDEFDLTRPLFTLEEVSEFWPDAGLEKTSHLEIDTLTFMDGVIETKESEECEEEDERVEWSNDDILRLISYILESSLKILASRGNADDKRDVIQWIFEADFLADRHETGGYVIFTKDMPFKFAFCCKFEGFDPDFFRDYIASRLTRIVA